MPDGEMSRQIDESSKTFIWAAPKLAVEFYRFTVKTIFLDLSSRPSSLSTKQFSKLATLTLATKGSTPNDQIFLMPLCFRSLFG